MTFDVVIATYNRQISALNLVYQLNGCYTIPRKIIIVDSTDKANSIFNNINNVVYVHSSHKNQPYQRYLGYLSSKADIIVFLDDDMEVMDRYFISKLDSVFNKNDIVGVAIKFKEKHYESNLAHFPRTRFFTIQNWLYKIKGALTAFPDLPVGKYGLCGNRGKQPQGGGLTEWVRGGAFAARRQDLFRNFNFQLFDIFDNGYGMGEDGIIGYGLSKRGRLLFHDDLFFLHNDQKNSTYSNNNYAFARRVAFSRLYLSLEKSRLDGTSFFLARLHFHYYMFWRIMGLAGNYILRPNEGRKEILLGSLNGWRLAYLFKFDYNVSRTDFWQNEARLDGHLSCEIYCQ